MYKKSQIFLLLFIFVTIFSPSPSFAQPSQGALPRDAPKRTEEIYHAEYDRVWDNVVEILMEMGLSEHPHGKMSVDKKSGKITTPVFRYFKISSAKPVEEKDFQDSYTVTVETKKRRNKAKAKKVKVQIQRNFEIFDNVKKGWTKADPNTEKVGFTEEALLKALDAKMAATASAETDPDATPPNLIQTPPLFTHEESKPG